MKAERRLERAEEDVRAANRIAQALITRASGEPDCWRGTGHGRWGAAQLIHHLALTGRVVLDGLRVVAASGALTRPRARTPRQAAALKALMLTWHLPADLRPLPGTDPDAVILPARDLARQHTEWTAGFVALLRSNAVGFLEHVRWSHPRYGDLDALEWARFLRIYFRKNELRSLVDGGG